MLLKEMIWPWRRKSKKRMARLIIDGAINGSTRKLVLKAIKQVELESRNNSRNYIAEWFRYVELASKHLHKYLN